MKKNLQNSEWILSCSFLFVLIALCLSSWLHQHRNNKELIVRAGLVDLPIDVVISGEVSCPGVFSVLPGTRLGDVVKKSRPKHFANLRDMDLDSPVEKPLDLVITQLFEITIYVSGAVIQPTELKMATGSRICDLKSKIQCTHDADLRYFKRRRMLREGETILIPRQERLEGGHKEQQNRKASRISIRA